MEIPLCMQTHPKRTIECQYTDLTHPLDKMSIVELMKPIIKAMFGIGIAFHLKHNIENYNENMERLR